MIVFHPARSSLRELYVKWDRHIAHYRNMAEGKPVWQLRWLAQALLVFASLAPNAVTVLTSDRLHGSGVRLKAIAVLCAVRAHRAMTMISHLRAGEQSLESLVRRQFCQTPPKAQLLVSPGKSVRRPNDHRIQPSS